MFAARATLGFHEAADKTPAAHKATEAENPEFMSSGRVRAACPQVNHDEVGVLDRARIDYSFRTFASSWRGGEPEPLEAEKSKSGSEFPQRFERLVYRAAAEDMTD